MSTDRFVLGTAGHIDHGKTALVRALTGVDTDRLKEEKARGITIELGFASLQAEGVNVGVVDVPGHERFIRAMAAGATGVDAVMLVVAADEGVMPQTREHLAVCSLLGVQSGFVALNKVDLVDDPDWLDLVEADLHEAVAGTFLDSPEVVRCSAHSGQGVDEVRTAISRLAETVPARQEDGLFRLPMDRVFTIRGFGTVVTGTLIAGRVRVGDDLVADPGGARGKVRGLQVHGSEVEEARAGQRTAVNLKGVDRDDLSRGEVLVRAGTITPTPRFDAQVKLLDWVTRPLKRGQQYVVLHGTSQTLGRVIPLDGPAIRPGETSWAQLDLDRPLTLLPGDRFVLQGFQLSKQHGSTIGGGVVIRSHPPRRRRADEAYVALLDRLGLAPVRERVLLEVQAAGLGGLSLPRLVERLPVSPDETHGAVEALAQEGELVQYDETGAVVHPEAFARLANRIMSVVQELQEASPMADGFGRAEVKTRLTISLPERLHRLAVDRLIAEGRLMGDADMVSLPQSPEQKRRQELAEQARRMVEEAGLEPPKTAELGERLGLGDRDLKDVLNGLVKQGALVRAKDDLFFGDGVVEELQQRLVAYLEEKEEISPAEFKEMCGVSRKYLIPLAELFDARKVTLRVGNVRRLRS